MKLRATDAIAILAAILVIPFFFIRERAFALAPVSSALRIYGKEYFDAHVSMGLMAGLVEREQGGKLVETPHLLLPLYNPTTQESYLDAVMLTGLQRAMESDRCYVASQYVSPYQHTAALLTVNKMKPLVCKASDGYGIEDGNHAWQYEVNSLIAPTGTQGHIRHIIQEGSPTVSDWRMLKKRLRAVNSTQSKHMRTSYSEQKDRKHIAGITDILEVFLLSKHMKLLWVNRELNQLFQMEMDQFSAFQIVSYKVELTVDLVYASAIARSASGEGLLLMAALNIRTGATQWVNTAMIPSRAWSTRMLKEFEPDWLVSEIDAVCAVYNISTLLSLKEGRAVPKGSCTIDERKARKLGLHVKDNSWEILRRYLKQHDAFSMAQDTQQLLHGISHYIMAYEDDYISGTNGMSVIAFRSPTFIILFDGATGEEVVSFSIMPGVLLEPGDNYGEIYVSYLSDHSLKQAKAYDAKYYDYIRTRLVNGSLTEEMHHLSLSEKSALLSVGTEFDGLPNPIKSLIDPLLHIDERLNSHMAFFLSPGGIVYAISTATNTIIWRTSVTDFVPSSINAHMSIQRISSSYSTLVLTLNTHTYLFDLYNGKELAIIRMPEQESKHISTGDIFYDDEKSRTISTPLFAQIHPQEEKNTILLTSGPLLDIVETAPPDSAITTYWERTCIFLFIAAIFISASRIMPAVLTKDE